MLQSNIAIHAIRCYTAYALEIIEEVGFKAEMDYTTLSGSEPSSCSTSLSDCFAILIMSAVAADTMPCSLLRSGIVVLFTTHVYEKHGGS